MNNFFAKGLALLQGNFNRANDNFDSLAKIVFDFITKTKKAVSDITVLVTKETADRTAAIKQEVIDRDGAIAAASSSVVSQFDMKLNPLRAEMDVFRSGSAKIVNYLLNPSLPPTTTVLQLLTDALVLVGEQVVANRSYLLKFTGTATGTMTVVNGTATETISSGEEYLIFTDAAGAIANAAVFTNPVEAIATDFEGRFQELEAGIETIAASNDIRFTAQETALKNLSDLVAAA